MVGYLGNNGSQSHSDTHLHHHRAQTPHDFHGYDRAV